MEQFQNRLNNWFQNLANQIESQINSLIVRKTVVGQSQSYLANYISYKKTYLGFNSIDAKCY